MASIITDANTIVKFFYAYFFSSPFPCAHEFMLSKGKKTFYSKKTALGREVLISIVKFVVGRQWLREPFS